MAFRKSVEFKNDSKKSLDLHRQRVGRDEEDCPVCMERFHQPKSLPCNHAFCLLCLQKCSREMPSCAEQGADRNSTNTLIVDCPLCRQSFNVPTSGGIHSFQNYKPDIFDVERKSMCNGKINNVAEVEEHSDFNLNNDATVACEAERQGFGNRDNVIRDSDDSLRQMAARQELAALALTRLDREEQALLSETSTGLDRMSRQFEEIKRHAEIEYSQLKDRLGFFRDEKQSQIQKARKELLSQMQTGLQMAACEHVKQQEHCKYESVTVTEPIFTFTAATNILQDITSGRTSLIGSLAFNEMGGRNNAKTSASAKRVRLDRLVRLEPGGEVYGVTHLHDCIYVVCDRSDTIRVYNAAQGFKRLSGIHIKNKHKKRTLHAADITSYAPANILYISDRNNHCIWRLAVDTGLSDRWLKSTNHSRLGYGTISVTSDGRLIIIHDSCAATSDVMFDEDCEYAQPTLHIYGLDARLIQVITLSFDMKELQHAVEITSVSNFLVSHRSSSTSSTAHRVCEVTRDGRMVRTYGGGSRRGNEADTGRLNYPRHLALDAEGQNLFVADYNNNRVLILDLATLHCIGSVGEEAIKDGGKKNKESYQAWRLRYVPGAEGNQAVGGHLLVGLRSGHVDVFEVCSTNTP